MSSTTTTTNATTTTNTTATTTTTTTTTTAYTYRYPPTLYDCVQDLVARGVILPHVGLRILDCANADRAEP